MNFVWYRNVAPGDAFDALLTGRDGQPGAVSLPPGAGRRPFVDGDAAPRPRTSSRRRSPRSSPGVASRSCRRCSTSTCPAWRYGRTCLVGDAAFAVRPHAAAGTAKAAADGWALAAQITAHPGDLDAALAAWERRQLALGRALLQRNREIGDASQRHGTFRPGDPALIFGLRGPGA